MHTGPRYSLIRRLGEPHSQSGRFGKGENALVLGGIELQLFGRPTRRLVTILTELSRQLIDVMECEKNNIVSCKCLYFKQRKKLCIIQISVSVPAQLICSPLNIIGVY
jgi:hypothetical protein